MNTESEASESRDAGRLAHEQPGVRLIRGDARAALASMPADSVDCVVTSPPYYGLRCYGPGQYGLEATPGAYLARLRTVFRQVHRVLRPTGTLWIVIGDSYVCGPNGPRRRPSSTLQGRPQSAVTPAGFGGKNGGGLPSKSLIGIPWRLAIGLQEDGWLLRSAIVWHKPNGMPESVTDRPARRHEMVFLFVKQPRYFFALDAIREPHAASSLARSQRRRLTPEHGQDGLGAPHTLNPRQLCHPRGRNPGDVWSIGTRPGPPGHHATFPLDLPLRCVAAGCPPGGLVLDPFSGAATTGLAARASGRAYLGVDINPAYHQIAKGRLLQQAQQIDGQDRAPAAPRSRR